MNILITAAQGETFQRHFPAPILEQLRALGTVVCNPFPRPFTAQELAEALKDTDIVITHWGTPQIDACMLEAVYKRQRSACVTSARPMRTARRAA